MRRFGIFSVLALFCVVSAARASFMIEPANLVIRANMGETMVWADVVHTGGGPIAVELSVLERIVDIDGEFQKSNLPESREFTVFPSQIILQPRERARVQIVYRGRRASSDQAFHLFSREIALPVGEEADDVKVGVATLVSYYTAVAIETGRPGKLTFVSSKSIGDGRVEVIVENRSNGRVPVENMVITVGGREKIREFTGKRNSIMPGQQRRFTFPYARPLSAREVSFGTR